MRNTGCTLLNCVPHTTQASGHKHTQPREHIGSKKAVGHRAGRAQELSQWPDMAHCRIGWDGGLIFC